VRRPKDGPQAEAPTGRRNRIGTVLITPVVHPETWEPVLDKGDRALPQKKLQH
jgi:hypothetical protein